MQNKATEYVRKQLNLLEDELLALQHWFQILPDPDSVYKYGHNLVYIFEHSSDFEVSRIEFSLTTGQPATEADYQAYCEIVGVE